MDVNNLLDLYTDYLLVTPTYGTATGLSRVTSGKVSRDQVTRLLSGKIDSKTLWQYAKPLCHEIGCPDGLLIIDDSIEPKPHSKTKSLISWHFDHSSCKNVKEVNFVSSFYYTKVEFHPINVSKGERVKGAFHLQHVKATHNRIKKWISDTFWGVSTKYL